MHVDGRRAQHTNIGTAEDGGRHGFRIIGRVHDIAIEDSSAINCASDGLCIYHGLGLGAHLQLDTGIAKRIRVRRSKFNGNRRHGASYDSIDGALFEDCEFNDNGMDINGATVEGDEGSRLNGALYGSGIDAEEYAITTWTGNVKHVRCEFVRNAAAGFVALQPSANDASDPQWVPRTGYHFTECRFGAGVSVDRTDVALDITPLYGNVAKGTYFDDVQIIDCTLEGVVNIRAASRVQHRGGTVNGGDNGDYLGVLERVAYAAIDVPLRGDLEYDVVLATVVYAGSGGGAVDTGWIDESANLLNGTTGRLEIRRVGPVVYWRVTSFVPGTAAVFYTPPAWALATNDTGTARDRYFPQTMQGSDSQVYVTTAGSLARDIAAGPVAGGWWESGYYILADGVPAPALT